MNFLDIENGSKLLIKDRGHPKMKQEKRCSPEIRSCFHLVWMQSFIHHPLGNNANPGKTTDSPGGLGLVKLLALGIRPN